MILQFVDGFESFPGVVEEHGDIVSVVDDVPPAVPPVTLVADDVGGGGGVFWGEFFDSDLHGCGF